MTTEELYNGIGLNKETQEIVGKTNIDEQTYLYWKNLFENHKKSLYKIWEQRQDGYLFALVFYLKYAFVTYENYKVMGIPKTIYFDTLKDITIWNADHYKKTGTYGIKEYAWVGNSLSMDLFRIGRLQFQPDMLEKDIILNDNVRICKTKVLDIHIPEGEPLTFQLCKKSIHEAVGFFHKYFDEEYNFGLCTSWLLTPHLIGILNENSNIIQFQKLFQIYEIVYPFRQLEERVFGYISEDVASYPEDTSLQRKVKAKLKNGFDFGLGSGIIFMNQF